MEDVLFSRQYIYKTLMVDKIYIPFIHFFSLSLSRVFTAQIYFSYVSAKCPKS